MAEFIETITPQEHWGELNREELRVVYFLGTYDPEMGIVVATLEAQGLVEGIDFFFAEDEDGNPVDARESLEYNIPQKWRDIEADVFVYVEIGFDQDSRDWLEQQNSVVFIVDHHDEEQIQHDMHESELILMSSGVKVAILNGVHLTDAEQRVCAADHSMRIALSGAMHYINLETGEILGPIETDEILQDDRAVTLQRHPVGNEVFGRRVDHFRGVLEDSDFYFVGRAGEMVIDAMMHDLGENYSVDYLAMREAIYRLGDNSGVALIGNHFRSPEDPYRVFLMGHTSDDLVRSVSSRFFQLADRGVAMNGEYAPFLLPPRGYAGAYLQQYADVANFSEQLFSRLHSDTIQIKVA